MITLKDLIVAQNFPTIEVRTLDIFGEDILFGYYSYIDGELKFLDGDVYSLEEEVCGFEISATKDNEPLLIIWIKGNWLGDNLNSITINNKYEAQMLRKYLAAGRENTFEAKLKYLESLR